MEKVFNTYASRKGVSLDSLRFLIDGDRCVGVCLSCVCALPLFKDAVDCGTQETVHGHAIFA